MCANYIYGHRIHNCFSSIIPFIDANCCGKKKMLPFILGLLITVFFFSYFITQTYKNTAMQIGTIISTFVILIIFGNNHLEESWLLTITYLTLLYGSFYQFGLFSI